MRTSRALAALALAVSSATLAAPRTAGHNLRNHPARASAGSTLLYFGGPVIANPKVYVVWWDTAASVNPVLTRAPGIARFFEGVLDSPFIDSWAQYNTDLPAQRGSDLGDAGTGQWIGRGNYAGTYVLSPVPSGDVTDAQIQTALEAAITAGTLPPNDSNTIYSIFFPAAVTVSVDGGQSCSQLGFGGYHDQSVVQHAAYLVIPDCGYAFADYTSVVSHELAEATTDLIPTPGSNPNYPQAWNDSMGNESGDLCEASGGNIATGTGSFTVQGIWDQRSSSCKTTAHAAQDFSVSINPHAWTVATNGQAQLTVQTAIVSGDPQTLALSVAAPAGVTATLGAASVQTGKSTTLTVSGAGLGAAALRDGQVVVSATATTSATVWTHTAALLVNTAAVTDAFTVSLSPADQQASAGDTVSYTVQTAVISGTVPSIALSASSLPAGITATFTPATSAAGASSTLALTTTRALHGSYAFTVVANADTTRTASGTLELTAPTDGGASDGGTSDGGASDGGTSSTKSSSGCGQAPLEALGLPLVAMLLLARFKRRAAH